DSDLFVSPDQALESLTAFNLQTFFEEFTLCPNGVQLSPRADLTLGLLLLFPVPYAIYSQRYHALRQALSNLLFSGLASSCPNKDCTDQHSEDGHLVRATPTSQLSQPTSDRPSGFLHALTPIIQAIPPLSQWKNAGHGASQPGRQLGSPSVALKTCYPPECIRLAYSPDPLSEPPHAAPLTHSGAMVK
ncbi:Argininosuccinate synthase, partial [Dissostichus eleginoides]